MLTEGGWALWSLWVTRTHQLRRRKDAEKLRQLAESPAASLVPVCSGRSLVSGASAALVPLTAATAQGLVAEGSLTFLGLRPRDGAAVFAGECAERVDALAAGSAAGQARQVSGRAATGAAERSQGLLRAAESDMNRRPIRSQSRVALCLDARPLLHQGQREPRWLKAEPRASRRAGWT